jgi:hypothetical protein
MSMLEDLRVMAGSHRAIHGREPMRLKLGHDAANQVAAEMSEMGDFFTEDGRPATKESLLRQMGKGEVRLYGMTIELCDSVFPSPEQADAIEGYRHVGPC